MIAILGKGFISFLISSNNRNQQFLSCQKIYTLLGVLWNVWPWSSDYARLSFGVHWYLNVSIFRLSRSLHATILFAIIVYAGKNENPSARQKLFFHYKLISELTLIYIQLYIRLKVRWNDLFGVYFSFEVNKIFRLQITLNTLCKRM